MGRGLRSRADTTSGDYQAFLQFFETLLTPVIPLAITSGISAADLVTVVRSAYLRVLEKQLKEKGKREEITDTRLALRSGLTRSEVASMRARNERPRADVLDNLDESLRNVGILLTLWHSDPQFCGVYGVPLDLDLEPHPKRPHRSFTELLQKASATTSAPVTLDDLIAKDVVEVTESNLVHCRTRTVLPGNNTTAEKAELLAQCGRFLASAASAASHNILGADKMSSYFERLLRSDVVLSEQSLKQFHARAMKNCDATLQQLDTWVSRLPPVEAGEAGWRGGVGVFFFAERDTSDAAMPEKAELQSELDKEDSAGHPAEQNGAADAGNTAK